MILFFSTLSGSGSAINLITVTEIQPGVRRTAHISQLKAMDIGTIFHVMTEESGYVKKYQKFLSQGFENIVPFDSVATKQMSLYSSPVIK